MPDPSTSELRDAIAATLRRFDDGDWADDHPWPELDPESRQWWLDQADALLGDGPVGVELARLEGEVERLREVLRVAHLNALQGGYDGSDDMKLVAAVLDG